MAGAVLLEVTLPAPSGPMQIGTRIQHLIDSHRSDPVDPRQKRQLMVQFWYPTERSQGEKAPYVPDPAFLQVLVERNYYFQAESDLRKWGAIKTHALLNAQVSTRRQWPVLLVMPGLGLSRISYTTYCEDLASYGYFVAAIDPCKGGLTILPDGQVLSADDDPANEDPSKQAQKTAEWAGDISRVLDEISARTEEFSADCSHVGALGHSMGGSAAFQAAQVDVRLSAALDMDGSGGVTDLEQGARVPMLLLRSNPNYSDEDLAKLGRTRAQWEEMGKKGPVMFPPLLPGKTSAPVFQMAIRDTGHLSYSDAPFLMANTITRFSNHPLEPNRTLTLAMGITRAFFDNYLRQEKWSVLDSLMPPWKEVSVVRIH